MKNIKLLLVEDDEDDYVLTRDLLHEAEDVHYILDWVSTAASARDLLAENEHDVCLMDYQLGATDGIQLLKEASQFFFDGPIIMLTGAKDEDLDTLAMNAGAVDYLVKATLTKEYLLRSINYALARRDVERERSERLRAESENRAKSEFLARLSHELRTPLTAILGYSDVLLSKIENLEDKSHLHIIHNNGKHLLGLLNGVLDLSKIEAGKLELDRSKVDVERFFYDVYMLMKMSAEDKGIPLSFCFHGEIFEKIYTDPLRLRQILLNLIGNAIKFTEHGEVRVEVSSLQLEEGEQLIVMVSDTGEGIDADNLEEIFKPFSQIKNNYVELTSGTGLGLTISRELAHRMGGDIEVKSIRNIGSEFFCSIAIEPVEAAVRRVISIDNIQVTPADYKVRQYTAQFLVVDDMVDIRRLIGHLLEMAGGQVSYASNGLEACEIIARSQRDGAHFDVVLMDVQMPVMTGLDAAKLMREYGYKNPLVALTASSMKGDREKCLASGFSDFIGKPIDSQRFYRLLDKLVPAERCDHVAAAISPAAGRTLLLVEDHPDTCEVTALLVSQLGWKVNTALTAKAALEHINNSSFDTVLCDLTLPDMDGLDLIKAIKDTISDTKIIVLSGSPISTEMIAAYGIKAALLKPVNLQSLAEVLAK